MAARARDDSTAARGKQGGARPDAYTGLLLISLLAQIIGVVFFYLDFSQYPSAKPTLPAAPSLSSAAPAPATAPGPGAPMAGGQPPMAGGAPPMAGGAPPMAGGAPK